MFQKLARGLSRPVVAAFVTINVEGEQAKPLATEYGVSSLLKQLQAEPRYSDILLHAR